MNKRKFQLIGSFILLMIGSAGILTFLRMFLQKENIKPWIITLLLSVLLVIKEIVIIIQHLKKSIK